MSFLSIRSLLKIFCQKRDEHKHCTTSVANSPKAILAFLLLSLPLTDGSLDSSL